jgi:AraC family transcriptional regulator
MSSVAQIEQSLPRVARVADPHTLDRLVVRLLADPPGVLEVPAQPDPVIVIHVGPSVPIECHREGRHHRGLSVHGDVDIIPAGVSSRWELKEKDTALVMSVPTNLLRTVGEQCDIGASKVEIVNRFQIRDRQIEHVGWALKTEMENGYPNGGLYLDSLATALAVHLLNHHSSESRDAGVAKGGLPGRRLRQVLAHIEDHLAQDLSLKEIAAVAGLSVSHCKTAFRKSTGQPIHQYVIQRRVERARTLLGDGTISISQVALETGFAHQSHLAYHMRRVLGVSPSSILRSAR